MESLTKENFWNDLHAKYPLAVDQFCKWIDEYKKRIGWNKLFNDCYIESNVRRAANGEICHIDYSAPKFHDIPFDMQRGIITRFFEEHIKGPGHEVYKRICIEGITEFFETQNKILARNKLPTPVENIINH